MLHIPLSKLLLLWARRSVSRDESLSGSLSPQCPRLEEESGRTMVPKAMASLHEQTHPTILVSIVQRQVCPWIMLHRKWEAAPAAPQRLVLLSISLFLTSPSSSQRNKEQPIESGASILNMVLPKPRGIADAISRCHLKYCKFSFPQPKIWGSNSVLNTLKDPSPHTYSTFKHSL